MNWKALLPAAALLALLMPSEALSRNHNFYNDGGANGISPPGTLTPFSNGSGNGYLSGNVNQYSNNGYDPSANGAYGYDQYANNGNVNVNPYAAGANANGYNLSSKHHGGCYNPNSGYEMLRRSGQLGNAAAYGYSPNLNNPYANHYSNPYGNNANGYGYNNAANFGNPYGNGYYNGGNLGNMNGLGSALSGSGLGNLGTYAQNGNLNGGSLSGLRGLLGI
jgi:hypothetical protein